MRKNPHLVVSISGHGFGHVAQTAPVLNALHNLMPQLRITVRSSVAANHLRTRIHMPFTHLQSTGDIGMIMTSPLAVDVEKSRAAYCAFHADWPRRVAEEARLLQALGADLVLSNVGYLPLAGAQQTEINNIALCSLNWADIYRHYCCATNHDEMITAQIHASYANADAFLRATPGMAMNNPSTELRTGLTNLIPVSPIAEIGRNRRDELNRHLGLSNDEKLLLISMGGIASRLPVENWPRIKGVRYLVQSAWQITHPDAIDIESLPMNFSDLLASVDALLCKPGYGSFVEAASSGVPVLYVGRPDWPESPALTDWLQQHGTSREISHEAMIKGEIGTELEQLLSSPKPEAVVPSGALQVANLIAEKLY
jgi:hypothetical protein